MMNIIEWFNNNNGFVMIILTFVYAVTTIIMCKSAASANKISKDHFDDNLRYTHMPILTVEKMDYNKSFNYTIHHWNGVIDSTDSTKCLLNLKINNIGNGIATRLAYNIEFGDKIDNSFEIDLENSISAGNCIYKTFGFIIKNNKGALAQNADSYCTDKTYMNKVGVNIYFQDIIGNCYLKKLVYAICTTYNKDEVLTNKSVEIMYYEDVGLIETPNLLKNI